MVNTLKGFISSYSLYCVLISYHRECIIDNKDEQEVDVRN